MSPTDKVSLALLSGISSHSQPFSTSSLPEVITALQTCSKEPLPHYFHLHFPLETSHQMPPAPRPNSRTDGSMAILFWVTFQKLFQGTDSHRQSRVSKQDEPRGGGWFDTNLSLPSQQVT